jgi:hypothetical protein
VIAEVLPSSCGIAIAEVLPSSCGIAIADSKKELRVPTSGYWTKEGRVRHYGMSNIKLNLFKVSDKRHSYS